MRHTVALVLLLAPGWQACTAPRPVETQVPQVADKWFDRARRSYHETDIEDAAVAIENALRATPARPEVRLLGAKIALAQLEYDRCVELLQGLDGNEARQLRGRAHWYAGRVEQAADELEQLLSDPDVRDPWAKDIARLARRGSGRRPFELNGGVLAVVEMPRVAPTALVVPLEVNGEAALGMIATGMPEAAIEGAAGSDPSWISLRFGERIEVRDVPALSVDLSGVSRSINAPIRVLLGANLLRHLHPTFDLAGAQFVVRSADPPPPPLATTIRLHYLRGGGMVLRALLRADRDAQPAALMADSMFNYPLALDNGGWQKAGIALHQLQPLPNSPSTRQAVLPLIRLGALDVTEVLAVTGPALGQMEADLDVDLDGRIGSGLLAAFRVTLADRGRTMWLEPTPVEAPPGSTSQLPDDLSESQSLNGDQEDTTEKEEAPRSAPPAEGKVRSGPDRPKQPPSARSGEPGTPGPAGSASAP